MLIPAAERGGSDGEGLKGRGFSHTVIGFYFVIPSEARDLLSTL
jgi:hypothetical protein